ncbi:MAG: DUF4349 domain-containing protein [Actinobacteria bacterium]|nr:DUF4349 domain-containing protein [Actinomycetota bacterium]
MTSPDLSPELAALLRSSRPTASAELRARVRRFGQPASAPAEPVWTRLRLPSQRAALVVLPAAAALAIASAGVLGIARSDAPTPQAARDASTATAEKGALRSGESAVPDMPTQGVAAQDPAIAPAISPAIAPGDDRAQRINATMTVEVENSNGVSSSAQKALDLTRRLGGHVVSASVATGQGANASLTLRVPVTRVQEAIAGLSALGTIVSQQVSIEDLQTTLDQLERRERSVRAQIALLVARLDSDSLDAETRARFESRLKNLRTELRSLRGGIAGTNAEARMATIQLNVITPETSGVVPTSSRLDRTLDEALNVLVWEGVVTLAIIIVAAPFALLLLAVWFGNRFYRRREEDRLLAI